MTIGFVQVSRKRVLWLIWKESVVDVVKQFIWCNAENAGRRKRNFTRRRIETRSCWWNVCMFLSRSLELIASNCCCRRSLDQEVRGDGRLWWEESWSDERWRDNGRQTQRQFVRDQHTYLKNILYLHMIFCVAIIHNYFPNTLYEILSKFFAKWKLSCLCKRIFLWLHFL